MMKISFFLRLLPLFSCGFPLLAIADESYPSISYEYSDYGDCTAITNELGAKSTYAYDDYHRCTSYTEPLTVNSTGTVQTSRRWDWVYDRDIEGVGLHPASSHTSHEWRLQTEPAYDVDGHRPMTARMHDVNNRVTQETTGLIATGPISWLTGPETESHWYTYNKNGDKETHRAQLTQNTTQLTTFGYDIRNRVESTTEEQGNRITSYKYDYEGNKTQVTFPDQYTQKWSLYDAFGQAGKFVDERGNETDLSYYPWGPMKKLYQVTTYCRTDSGSLKPQLTVFNRDWLGRPRDVQFPDSTHELSTYEFEQLSTWTTRKGQVKRISYDARGREIFHTWDNEAAPRIDRGWDNANRLLQVWNKFSHVAYTYDAAGQIETEASSVSGARPSGYSSDVIRSTSYERYPNGEPWMIYCPSSFTAAIVRAYTARGQLQRVGYLPGSSLAAAVVLPALATYSYRADGKVDSQTALNGLATQFGYDQRGYPDMVRHYRAANNQTLATRDYLPRDSRDRITGWSKGTNNSGNAMENGRGDCFAYDEEGQLTNAWHDASSSSSPTPSPTASPTPTGTPTSTPIPTATPNGRTNTTVSSAPSSRNPSQEGEAASFTATIGILEGGGVPEGTVIFSADGIDFSTKPLSALRATSDGISTLSVGNHQIKATFSPDANSHFDGSSDDSLTQEVQDAPPSPSYGSAYVSISTLPESLHTKKCAQTVTLNVKMQNTGDLVWHPGTVRLVPINAASGWSPPLIQLDRTVAKDETVTFTSSMTLPPDAEQYPLQYMLEAAEKFFGEPTALKNIQVSCPEQLSVDFSAQNPPPDYEFGEVFQYDEMGNRKQTNTLSNRGQVVFTRSDNGLNQYTSWGTDFISHDQNGAMFKEGYIQDGEFNALNQPVRLHYAGMPADKSVYFGYDPLGRCVKRWTGTSANPASNPATYFYYDGWNLIQEGPNEATPSRIYVHGARVDEIVADYTYPSGGSSSGQWNYHHYDAQGNAILLTNSSGNIIEQYSYDAFGKPYFYRADGTQITNDLNAYGNRFLFQGREFLADLQLYDFRFRLYHPELGRFIQPDPKQYDAGDYNLYRFCHNDPVNKTDPMGLLSFSGTAEYQRLVPVLGSNIPQWLTVGTLAVNFTTSGNFSNADAASHVVAAGVLGALKGRTDTSVAVKQAGKALTANLNIDYYIIAARYNALERQHTFGADGSKTKGLLEQGGFWDKAQKTWAGGIGDFLGRWRLERSLNQGLQGARAEQSGTWDHKGGDHDVPW